MNQFFERFKKLPRSQRWLVAGVLYIAVVAVFYFLLIAPTMEQSDAAANQNVELTAKRDKVRARADNLAQFQQEFEVLLARLKQALKELPNDREIPGLLSEIDQLARKSGLEVRKFQPLPEVVHEYYAEVPVQIIMEGTFHEFGIFFDRVSKMSRIVSEKDIEIGTPVDNGTETTLTVAGKTVTYRFLTDEEVEANRTRQEAASKSRKGGDGE